MKRALWPAVLTGSLVALVPAAAHADLWSVDSSVESRLETNDNNALAPTSVGTVNTWALSSSLAAARRTENAATRLNADITALEQSGGRAGDRFDARLGLAHSYSDPRNTGSLGVNLAQDFNEDLLTADVTQARGRRRTTGLSASWSHALSERLSASTQLAFTRAGYWQELTQATDFRNVSLTLGASYLLSENETATAQVSHGDYRTLAGDSRSATNSIDLGMSRVVSERASASLSLGVYETQRSTSRARLACPLQFNFCSAGLVPYIVVVESAESSSSGLQFSASARYQFDERTGLSFSASRQQSPSGAGSVVRSDSVSLGASRSWSPTLSAALNYNQSRSTLPGAAGAEQPGQWSLSASFSQQLERNLSLQGGYRRAAADRLANGQSARSNSFYVAVKYDWAKFEASR